MDNMGILIPMIIITMQNLEDLIQMNKVNHTIIIQPKTNLRYLCLACILLCKLISLHFIFSIYNEVL